MNWKGRVKQNQFLNCLCLASRCSWMLISLSIAAHEHSNSTWLVVVYRMVLNRFKAILVWSWRSGSMLGCLLLGTVMEDKTLFICERILIKRYFKLSRDENRKNNFEIQNTNINTFEVVSWIYNNFENPKITNKHYRKIWGFNQERISFFDI